MRNRNVFGAFAAGIAIVAMAATIASAQVQITEYMYGGNNGEFVELTNTGSSAVDFTGWSFDDDSRVAGTVDLSSFGTVGPGESVIITETEASAFRTAWSLAGTVKVLGSVTTNFGRADEYNVFDAMQGLADRLAYNDQAGQGPRANNFSVNIPSALFDAQVATSGMPLSAVGDGFGSYQSAVGATSFDTGNPGTYAVPEPATLTVLGAAASLILRRKRR